MTADEAGLLPQYEKLRDDLTRWKRELSNERLGSSAIIGKATKALSAFEVMLRTLLAGYVDWCSVDYDSEVAPLVEGKSLDLLTLGETISCLDNLNKRLTKELRKVGITALERRSLLTQAEVKSLRYISTVRKSLHKANLESAVTSESALQLVGTIEQCVAFAVFSVYLKERSEDGFRRAQAIRERIAARTGKIDTMELLDSVRGPWESE